MPLRRKPRWFSENLVNSVQLLVDLTPESRIVFGEALDAHVGVVDDLERSCAGHYRVRQSDSGYQFDACLRDKVKLQRAHGGCSGDERR